MQNLKLLKRVAQPRIRRFLSNRRFRWDRWFYGNKLYPILNFVWGEQEISAFQELREDNRCSYYNNQDFGVSLLKIKRRALELRKREYRHAIKKKKK